VRKKEKDWARRHDAFIRLDKSFTLFDAAPHGKKDEKTGDKVSTMAIVAKENA